MGQIEWEDNDFNEVMDIPEPSKPEYPAAEKAYRRGFSQGADAAIQAVIGGASIENLQLWLDEIEHWREHDLRKPFEPPKAL
jgi:hypothetical protein